MTRCMNETFFRRVVCLVIFFTALMFLLILTFVFVDIDGLISKTNDNTVFANSKPPDHLYEAGYMNYDDIKEPVIPESYYINVESDSDAYRNKRAIELDDRNQKITQTDNKINESLVNKLSEILDKLNFEKYGQGQENEKTTPKTENLNIQNNENVKHLALHNLLLRGMLIHTDINQVYNKVKEMDKNFKQPPSNIKQLDTNDNFETNELAEDKYKMNNEHKILNEILNCSQLKQDLQLKNNNSEITEEHNHYRSKTNPQILIKTVLDISGIQNNNTNIENENIKGIFNIFYNGKPIKFNQVMQSPLTTTVLPKIKPTIACTRKNDFVKQLLEDYYKKYHSDLSTNTSNEFADNYFKRSKRFVKVANVSRKRGKLIHNKLPRKLKKNHKKMVNDDLYVEIQTHFYKNGSMGEKRKKLVQNLIDKIEKAITSNSASDLNTDQNNQNKVRSEIKKRTQNPLKSEENVTKIMEKYVINKNELKHRYINPLSTLRDLEKYTNSWKSKYTKHLNDESKIGSIRKLSEINNNDVSPRQQKPILNNNDENKESDFVITDVDGAGISVGIHQYVDQPPDSEEFKVFTNVENLIHSYHQNFNDDHESISNDQRVRYKRLAYFGKKKNGRFEEKWSNGKCEDDNHQSIYSLLFARKPVKLWPYVNYKDIINNEKPKSEESKEIINYRDRMNITAFNKIIMRSKLNPSQILSISDLISNKRRKRYINLHKHSKTKIVNKKIHDKKIHIKLKSSRIKRHTRGDMSYNYGMHSTEDILTPSNENIYADRAIVKDPHHSEHINVNSYEKPDFSPNVQIRSVYGPGQYLNNFFNTIRTSKNKLLNKYPHLFVEEHMKSKEQGYQDDIINPEEGDNYDIDKHDHELGKHDHENMNQNNHDVDKHYHDLDKNYHDVDKHKHDIEPDRVYPEFIPDLIAPPDAKSNYKVTVRILPRNLTDISSGFKEVQTSINKTYNKNGIAYVSLLNIKEISKIENLNKTDKGIKNNQMDRSNIVKEMLHAKKLEREMEKIEREKEKVDKYLSNSASTDKSNKINEYINTRKKITSTPSVINKFVVKNNTEPILNQTNPLQVIEKHVVDFSKTEELIKKLDKNTEVLEKILKTINQRNEANPHNLALTANLEHASGLVQHPKSQNPIASVIYHGVVYNSDNFSVFEPNNPMVPKISKAKYNLPAQNLDMNVLNPQNDNINVMSGHNENMNENMNVMNHPNRNIMNTQNDNMQVMNSQNENMNIMNEQSENGNVMNHQNRNMIMNSPNENMNVMNTQNVMSQQQQQLNRNNMNVMNPQNGHMNMMHPQNGNGNPQNGNGNVLNPQNGHMNMMNAQNGNGNPQNGNGNVLNPQNRLINVMNPPNGMNILSTQSATNINIRNPIEQPTYNSNYENRTPNITITNTKVQAFLPKTIYTNINRNIVNRKNPVYNLYQQH